MPEPFDFENAVDAWKAEASRKNIRNGSLEELERHLRDAFALQTSMGTPEAEAWKLVTEDLGSPRDLANEFTKLDRFNLWDVSSLLFLGSATWATLQIVFTRVIRPGGLPEVLAGDPISSHVAAVGIAACFAVLTGFCGAYVLTRRRFSDCPCPRVEVLFRRIVIALSVLVFIGSLGGFVVGLVWAEKFSGVHSAWYDPRVLGCVALVFWSGASLWFNLRKRIGPKLLFRLAIVGSLIITDVWLTPILFKGEISLMIALLAIPVCAAQLVPFFLNWEEDFPANPASN